MLMCDLLLRDRALLQSHGILFFLFFFYTQIGLYFTIFVAVGHTEGGTAWVLLKLVDVAHV